MLICHPEKCHNLHKNKSNKHQIKTRNLITSNKYQNQLSFNRFRIEISIYKQKLIMTIYRHKNKYN